MICDASWKIISLRHVVLEPSRLTIVSRESKCIGTMEDHTRWMIRTHDLVMSLYATLYLE